MRSNYKKLGQFIQQVDIRNKRLEITKLLGVSIQKIIIPSIANTIGTNLKTYKIIEQNQFVYGPVTSRNGEKVSIALLEEIGKAIVSQAYTVFEIINKKQLLPGYLMMWFRRPEFDRYARYKSHGSVREIFDWEEMCEVELPVPSIEKQQEIVDEYNTITNRIKLNEQLNKKLEETAQSIYKHWFVDFEFPNEDGKPYKSSNGKMVWNEELEKEIPEGWEGNYLGEVSIISAGGDKPRIFSDKETNNCKIPIYSNSMVNEGLFGFTDKAKVFDKSITISARGGIGFTKLRMKPYVPIVRLIVVIPKIEYQLNYIFLCASSFEYDDIASAQGQLTIPDVSSFKVLSPDSKILEKYQEITSYSYKWINKNIILIKKLNKLRNLLLSKMAKG